MNPHPPHTGEYLAHRCLDEASGDYSLAADLVMSMPDSQQRDHAMKALALWAAFHLFANDNDAG